MLVAVVHQRVEEPARPDELDVLAQRDAVVAALRALGHGARVVEIDLDLEAARRALEDARADVCFNLVESLGGHGRLVHVAPMAFEAWGLRFTGCGGEAMYTATGKLLAKRLMRAGGLPTPEWLTLPELRAGRGPESGGRWIVKSVWEHASVGLDEDNVVGVEAGERGRARLLDELERRLASLGGEGFAERYIEGREFNVAVLAGRVLRPAEMVFEGYGPGRPRVVGYRAKWDAAAPEYHQTVRRFAFPAEDGPLLRRIEELCRACWARFGLRGWARVDFRVDEDGRPWILEVNANPCLAPDAGFAAGVEASGLTYAGAIGAILADV